MKAYDAINEFSMYSPNTLDEVVKYKWLSTAENHVREILNSYEDNQYPMIELSPDTNINTELSAKEPYSELYRHYMLAQINLLYGDTAKYNVFAQLYESTLSEFRMWCVRTYRSKNENYYFKVV